MTAVDLGTLGGAFSAATAINSRGDIVGESAIPGDPAFIHGFFWSSKTGMTDIGALGGRETLPVAINDHDQVVGIGQPVTQQNRSFFWSRATGIEDIGTLGGTFSGAVGISADGTVAGYSYLTGDTGNDAYVWTRRGGMQDIVGGSAQAVGADAHVAIAGPGPHAFVWNKNHEAIDLGTLGGDLSWPTAVSAVGEVVGYSTTADGQTHAFAWTSARGMVDLGAQGGVASFAEAVNTLGQVAGVLQFANGDSHAFIWSPRNGMQDLGTLPGDTTSSAVGIDDQGDVAGNSFAFPTPTSFTIHGFVWTPEADMTALPTLGGSQSLVKAISRNGTIVGTSDLATNSPDGTRVQHATAWLDQGGR